MAIFKDRADRDGELLLAVTAAAETGAALRALHSVGVNAATVAARRLTIWPQKLFDVGAGLIFGQIQDVLTLLGAQFAGAVRRFHAGIIVVPADPGYYNPLGFV